MKRLYSKRLDLIDATKDHRKFQLKRGDSKSNWFNFIVQQKGEDVDLSGFRILVNFLLPNRNIVRKTNEEHPDLINVEGNEISVIVPTEVSQYVGDVLMEVAFFKDDVYLTSKRYTLFVNDSINLDLTEEEQVAVPLLIELLNLTDVKVGEFVENSKTLLDQFEVDRNDALGGFANDSTDAIEGFINESKDVESKYPQRLSNLEGRVGYLEMGESVKRYGVRRKLGATSAELERLGDAVGLVANADTSLSSYNNVVNDFDDIYPWSHMRRCKITETGRIIYDSYPNYDQTEGDWMIEIPEFYIKHTNDGEYLEYWVSDFGGKDYDFVDKFYIAQFKTTDGHKSLPHTPPLVLTPLSTFRNSARNKGSGWQVVDMKAHYAIRVLYQVEFAHLNSQSMLGVGVTGTRYTENDNVLLEEDNTNRVVISDASAAYYELGETVEIGTARGSRSGAASRLILEINSLESDQTEMVLDGEPFDTKLNYVVYSMGQHSGKTLDLTSSSGQSVGRSGRASISYRGIEDLFGNVYENIDGILVNNHQTYVCEDPSKFTGEITEDYIPLGYTNATSDAWVTTMGFDEEFKYAELPTQGGGGSSTGYCDHYYQNTGLRVPRVGGYFYAGSFAGLFLWDVNSSVTSSSVSFGARLLYRP